MKKQLTILILLVFSFLSAQNVFKSKKQNILSEVLCSSK